LSTISGEVWLKPFKIKKTEAPHSRYMLCNEMGLFVPVESPLNLTKGKV